MKSLLKLLLGLGLFWAVVGAVRADSEVTIAVEDIPDYHWYAGCFGTACGNLMGFWDRNGFPDFYTGPTAGGVAPLGDGGSYVGIRSMWASKAGVDGRPADQFGHIDDYWDYYVGGSFSYESTKPDPYVTAGRPEHTPDCIGDFIGLSQKRWTNMNGECDGNIDAYSFVYWDPRGARRVNYQPSEAAGTPARDIPSGLREWTHYRGYEADVFSQLADFNPTVTPGAGFSFEALKQEINSGYPLLVFLQNYNELSRNMSAKNPPMPRANPDIHGMLIYGYGEDTTFGLRWVYCRTSWASGDYIDYDWSTIPFVPSAQLSVRGVIGYHPKPQIRSITRSEGSLTIAWDGPSVRVRDEITGLVTTVHRYQLEESTSLASGVWSPVGLPTTDRTLTVSDCCPGAKYYRVRLLAGAP